MTAPIAVNPTLTRTNGNVADGAIKYALAQVGKPYVWGGTGPKGYDCSGLLYMAYLSAGLNITRTTHTQIMQGTPLPNDMPVNQRPAGCLIFPDSGHVYMALGGGQIVEAPHTGTTIRVRNDYSPHAYAIRQVVGAGSVAGGQAQGMVNASLGGDILGATTGIDPDTVSHWIDVMLNWIFYSGLILVGGLGIFAGAMWIAGKPITAGRALAQRFVPSQ